MRYTDKKSGSTDGGRWCHLLLRHGAVLDCDESQKHGCSSAFDRKGEALMRLVDMDGIDWDKMPTESGYIHKDDLREWLEAQPVQIAIPIAMTQDTEAQVFAAECASHMMCSLASYGRMLLRIMQAGMEKGRKDGGNA